MKGRKILALLLTAILAMTLLSACAPEKKQSASDDALTMYVGLGNSGSGYYTRLHDAILENLGIDVQFVFSNTMDTTNAMRFCVQNNDLPADIMITALRLEPEEQQAAFLDLAAYTNIPDSFTTTKLQSITVDGGIYQLPYSSRLIGIEYNKTLLEEMGWTLPDTYEEMAELKQQVEAAGYTFAIAGGVATGHGFNYLFHLMGSQYLSAPDGSEWFRLFRSGETGVEDFAAEAEYFKQYAESGLFGELHNADWEAAKDFCRRRALFYYNIINDCYSYDGYRYNADGTIYGAEYGADGMPVAEPDPEGEAVLLDGEYVYYEESNEAHQNLDRYTIPGAEILHDSYGSMPWITESGSSNCFTTYDNMFVALDKDLGSEGQQDKLEQAVQVLEFMTTETVTDIFSELYADGYVATVDYEIDESRLYYEYADRIESGYIANWYYNDFDMDSIVNVGQVVNDYLLGTEGVEFDDIIAELEQSNENYLKGENGDMLPVSEQLDYEDNARMQAIANALSLQSVLDEAGQEAELTVSLMPYIQAPGDITKEVYMGLVQVKIYAGEWDKTLMSSCVSVHSNAPVAIEMTGAEIEQLVENGYNSLADFDYDHTFDYECVIKGDGELEAGESYWVAVSPESLESEVYNGFLEDGRVITEEDTPLSGTTVSGLEMLMEDLTELSPDALIWE